MSFTHVSICVLYFLITSVYMTLVAHLLNEADSKNICEYKNAQDTVSTCPISNEKKYPCNQMISIKGGKCCN